MKYFKVIFFIVLLLNINVDCQQIETKDEVRFVVFGDSQFGNPPEFERMIHEAEMLRPNFAIQVGDLIHGYTKNKKQLRSEWKRYKKQISPFTSPYYPVPGNHDVVTDEAEEVYIEEWGKDKLYYSFDLKHAHIIVLDSWWQEADDRIEEWQRDWLKKDLEKYADQNGGLNSSELNKKSIFVFLHSPLWKYPEDHEGKKDWNLVHDILKEYPVKLVAAGHSHEYVWHKKDDINYLIINSAGVSRPNTREGKFSSFLHVSVFEDGTVNYANIEAGSVLPLDSVTPEERKTVPEYKIREQTLQLKEWKTGENITRKIEVPITNELKETRRYRLDWYIPYGAEVKIEPESMWIEIPAGETIKKEFTLSTKNAPSEDNLPWLEITSKKELRTGVVSRDIEKKYRDNPTESSIILDAPVEFKGKYRLFVPPIAVAKKKINDIKLDGKIEKDEWNNASVISEFYKSGKILSNDNTSVSLLYDENFLYVGIKMAESNPDGLRTEAIPPIPLTWDDDDIELFFDPAQSQSDYIRLFQNAAGTRFNSLPRWHPNKYFASKYESAIHIGDDYWSIEMIIPWSDIDLKEAPKSGDSWGFNIGRHRQQSDVKRSKWSGNLYNPKSYGVLIFE